MGSEVVDKSGDKIDWKKIFEDFEKTTSRLRPTIGLYLGNWRILAYARRGRMFDVRVEDMSTGTVIDVMESFDSWQKDGVLPTIQRVAKEHRLG